MGPKAVLIGFSTDTGTVTAAQDWNLPAQRRLVRPALAGSYEALFYEAGLPDFLLDLRTPRRLTETLRMARLERAIGVIYRPETERDCHYFFARLPEQFDIMLPFDETEMVEPMERIPDWEPIATPETYPTGI